MLDVTRAGVQLFGSAQQIDSSDGKFAGTYWDFADHHAVAFVGENGKWRRDVKISEVHQASAARGINGTDAVVGSYFRPPMRGFLVSNKKLSTIDYPSARNAGTELEGINDSGQAVGQWVDRKGATHSFLLDIASNTFTDIKVKGATEVKAWGINAAGRSRSTPISARSSGASKRARARAAGHSSLRLCTGRSARERGLDEK